MTEDARVSFLPKDAEVGGGSLSDVDAKIVKARFAPFDYNGKVSPAVCALLVTYLPKGMEVEEGEELPWYLTAAYSCGPLDKYTATEDGTGVIAAGSAKGFNKQSNVMTFFTALVNKGFPEATLAKGDISVLDGMEVHLVQVAQQKREGLKGSNSGDDPKGIVLIDKILAMPGEVATPKPKAADKPATEKKAAADKPKTTGAAPKALSASSPEIIEAAHAAIMQIVSENGGKATKAEIAGKIFKLLAGEPDVARKNAIIQAAYKDETLESGPWTFEGTTVTLG